jgi:hypothetical protein
VSQTVQTVVLVLGRTIFHTLLYHRAQCDKLIRMYIVSFPTFLELKIIKVQLVLNIVLLERDDDWTCFLKSVHGAPKKSIFPASLFTLNRFTAFLLIISLWTGYLLVCWAQSISLSHHPFTK